MQDPLRFDRITQDTRKVLSYAQEEAQRFNHNYIGTEHLVLGLVRLEEGITATVLQHLGVELWKVRSAVEFIIGRGDRIVLGEVGLTPRAKQVIALAFDEAREMEQETLGPEHLLLGLVREGEGIGAGVLESLGVNLQNLRWATYKALGRPIPAQAAAELERLAHRWTPAEPPIAPMPPMPPFARPLHGYRPYHLETAQPQRTAVDTARTVKPAPSPQHAEVPATLLGWVVVNTGGEFTLTLYDGLEAGQPLAVITHPPTGAFFPFHCVIQHGLAYTLEGTPGSVTIICDQEQMLP